MLAAGGTRPNSAPYRRLKQAGASIPPVRCASRRYEGDRNIYCTAVSARRNIYSRRALRSREVGGANEPECR